MPTREDLIQAKEAVEQELCELGYPGKEFPVWRLHKLFWILFQVAWLLLDKEIRRMSR